MTKSDLKSGMVVKTREGKLGLVMLGTPSGDAIVADGEDELFQTWKPFTSILDDLTSDHESDDDIVEVWSYKYNSNSAQISTSGRKLLWSTNKIKFRLNDEYTADIDKKNKVVKVGCQEFSFDVIKELYCKMI